MSRSLQSLLLICILPYLPTSLARQHAGFRHEAVDALYKRQIVSGVVEVIPINATFAFNATVMVNATLSATTTSTVLTTGPVTPTTADQYLIMTEPRALTTITPSPSALPVRITSQSQVVESFVLAMTWCVGGPVALVPMQTLTGVEGAPYENGTTLYATATGKSTRCETMFIPTQTTVCATTLTALASKMTVSECDQEITFSSECGFTLEKPAPTTISAALITPAPTVRRMMTYWMAPWQSLTMGETPSDVDIKVCTIQDDDTMRCERYQEVWEVIVLTSTVTTEREVQIATTVSGPGTLVVESLQAEVTDTLVYFNFSIILHLQTEVEVETTSRSPKTLTGADGVYTLGPTSTTYLTIPVQYNTAESNITVGVVSTATHYVNGTTTMTRLPPRPTGLRFIPVL